MSKLTRRRRWPVVASLTCICLSCAFMTQRHGAAAAAAEDDRGPTERGRVRNEKEALIESALFARTEFFGARALVPYPTAEARNRLADLLEKYPNEPPILLRLSQLDEKLGRFEEAARELETYVQLQPDNAEALETLAAFLDRRAQFEKEAATLERLLAVAPQQKRASVFGRLIELARIHRLENYLKPDFYEKYIAQNASVSGVVEQLLDKLTAEENYAEALKVLRQYRDHFPQRQSYVLEKEVSLLVSMKKSVEAERVYREAFDPFWPAEMSSRFYGFLSDRDRFRAYGHELAEAFARNPANFDVAVRLIHYRNYTGETSARITAQLEQARAARRPGWKPEELATLARLLIADGDGDTASRFLYTLYVRNELKPGSPLRAKVLYQLFELLADARGERLALTRGDLKFYQDIATSDPHPGMLGGVLSLILSDTNPASELKAQEQRAVEHFNRAAAFRIFTAYKQEYPTSTELAQMYLDIVRLYAATKEPKIAEETLAEFEGRYRDAPHYAEVALKLADCYIALGKAEEERAVYRRIMNYLGERRERGISLVPAAGQTQTGAADGERPTVLNLYSEPTETKPSLPAHPPQSNRGIDIPSENTGSTSADYDNYSGSAYTDHLATVSFKPQGAFVKAPDGEAVSYASVLERCVASLAREKRTEAILTLYADEMKKYPDEQGLYEQMLQWLGQTNLLEEQLNVHKQALRKFPTTLWRDRLARWFLRRERRQEFETFSRELLEQLSDREIQEYLGKFVGANTGANASTFEAQLYLGLYTLAHERFPHNLSFVEGLLKFYRAHKRWDDWRGLLAEYYFESHAIRDEFLSHLASRNELRSYLERAREQCRVRTQTDGRVLDTLPYKLFRADAAVRLSNYEEAIDAYRELNRLYPHTPEFAERLIAFTRSLGQRNPKFLEEAASVAHEFAESFPASAAYRTRAGEIQAELGDYDRARGEWEQLIQTGRGAPDTYLETATVYWDYFQYADALRTIEQLRRRMNNPSLYAFQAGAILEAEHKTAEALGEYVKALNFYSSDDEEARDGRRAKRRLVKLYRREGIPAKLQLAFARERARRADKSALILDYAGLLNDAGESERAAALLKREIARSDSRQFLNGASSILPAGEDRGVDELALKRLVAVEQSPRFAISYRLRLAEDAEQHGRRREAEAVLHELTGKFPTNYGVLNEAESFYWRMNLRERSLRVLTGAMQRGKGRFNYIFGRKLAARLVLMNRLPAAEQVLARLHAEDKLNTEVFHELARVLIRTSKTDALKKAFAETLAAIREQDLNRTDLHAQTAALRVRMIDAFTRLGDYHAAIEQHIEIINREPEDEQNVEAAIDYARRYGGAETLLAYYRRTSQEAYKNYRWNVVLARLHDAGNDLPGAAQNYREAIANQPEMVELYDALADVYTRMKNTDAALEALKRTTELTNDDPRYIKRIVEVLEKAGRHREAAEARRKLPDIAPQKETSGERFADAARLRTVEKSGAVAAYRLAFDAFFADPSAHKLKAEEITSYVQSVRDEERLDHIAARLWQLRDKLIQEAGRKNSTSAGRARDSLKVLDGALPEAVGVVASRKATGDELSALFADFNLRIEAALSNNDRYETLELLQNLSHRSGFGVLEERILSAQKDAAYRIGNLNFYHERLQRLVDFYTARGDYGRVVDLMEAERAGARNGNTVEHLRIVAKNARLLGDREKELQALRENYRRLTGSVSTQLGQADDQASRYLEALYENGEQGKQELSALAQQTSPYQLHLINFLLAKGERELAHEAIERAPFAEVWKLSHHAGASLALHDYSARSAGYFDAALQLKSIGEMIARKPDASRQLVGDDWFRLAQSYGQWLGESARDDAGAQRAGALLVAMIENRPRDADEQTKLGRMLLDGKDYKHALEHLSLALEMNPADDDARAALGSAVFLSGDKAGARELWSGIIKGGDDVGLAACELYLRTLRAYGLAAEAREILSPIIVKQISLFSDYEGDYENAGNADSYAGQRQKQLESLRQLIRALAASFGEGGAQASADESLELRAEIARAKFFYKLSDAVADNTLLPKMSVKESLVSKDQLGPFYELLIKRSPALSRYERDYDYTAHLRNTWSAGEAEEALDQELGYKISEPPSERLKWQRDYLDYLIAHDETATARQVISTVETEISQRYARPAWLRLMRLRLELPGGQEKKTLAGLRRFTGIDVAAGHALINPPSVERLNMAVSMLREEGRPAQADQLLESAYTRVIALERYEGHAFVGLAQLAFGRGDAALGLKLLRTMVALSDAETMAAAAAEVASWPSVKVYAADRATQDGAETENTLDHKEALRLAAETSATFAQFDAAINYRQQLFALSPEDETTRIELARLLAEKKNYEQAVAQLAQIIGDRTATRRARWQAVRLAPEIIGERYDLWAVLTERVRALNAGDDEMLAALSSSGQGRATDESVKLINTLEATNPNPYLHFFGALLERRRRSDVEPAGFFQTLIAGRDETVIEAFGFAEESALRRIIRFYAVRGRPRAALLAAELDPALKESEGAERGEAAEHDEDAASASVEDAGQAARFESRESMAKNGARYRTLSERAVERERQSRGELLGLLSAAAEQIGDLDRAVKFETAKLKLLPARSDRQPAEARIRQLRSRRTENSLRVAVSYSVDQRLVAQR